VTTFEAWASTGQTCDAVVSGQTWHWVDPVAGAAKRPSRSHRVAGWPRFWNVDQPPPELAEDFAAVYRRVMPDSPAARRSTAALRRVGDVVRQGSRRDMAGGRVRQP
jgi:hypothetical protein